MFDQFNSTQTVADQLKRLIAPHKADHPEQAAQAETAVQFFERLPWNPFAFNDASVGFLIANEDGRLQPRHGLIGAHLLEVIVSVLLAYQEFVAPAANTYTTEEAAAYLGMKPDLVNYHIHTSRRLSGEIKGHTRIFTQMELDAFKRQERKVGRPKKKQAE